MVKIVVFSADSLEGFIISSSMVGLGLILAIYTLTLPMLANMLKRRTIKLKQLIEEREKLFDKMKGNKNDTKLTIQYRTLQDNIRITEKLPFHLDLGYIFTGTFFALSLILPLLKIIFPDNVYISSLTDSAVTFFVFGIASFLLVWYLMFIEIRTFATEEFQKVKDNAQDKDEEVKELKIQFPIQSIGRIYRQRGLTDFRKIPKK